MLDVHPSVQLPSTTRKMVNFRVITRDGNSFILTNIKGMEQKGTLPANFVPIATAEKNRVAYIISAEVIDGVPTGAGEIGCFPSPDYSTGNLTYQYRPLMNYAGDDNSSVLQDGPFRSVHFNLDLKNIVDIELQNDYDRSVNIIFVDGKNPIRIINSGFAVKPGGKYEIVDRSGVNDTNRYSPKNFENVINLITRSSKLMKVVFEGSDAGGIVPLGNIQYYFAYATADGNETEIIAQSFNVPVFNGDRVSNIIGNKNTGEVSNKLNKFTLSNLDTSYANLVVYIVHADGMNGQVKSAYRINQNYPINGSSMSFVHTGYEDKNIITLNFLTDQSATIDTAGTITQSQGYLIAGNIKEKIYPVDALRKFSKKIKLGHKEVILDLIGIETGLTRLYDELINQTAIKSGTSGYNGGYANPRNVHDFTGHWGGEAYPYMVRYIFIDGTTSPLFPVIGVDNVNNSNLGLVESVTDSQVASWESSGGFSTDGNMLNSLGIYRFPNRNAAGVGKLFYKESGSGEGRIVVNGITFQIPDLDTDLGDGKTIKDYTIGVQFFRGERRPDVVIQGTMIDCQMVPLIRFDEANTDHRLWNYNGGVYNDNNCKLVPAYAHLMESIHAWDYYDDIFRSNNADGDDRINGLFAFKLNMYRRNPHEILTINRSPFALISTDLMVNPAAFSGISDRAITARLLSRMSHKALIKSISRTRPLILKSSSVLNENHFSALIPEAYTSMLSSSVYKGSASWAAEALEARNADAFSSMAFFQCRTNGSNQMFYLFRNRYNSYLGVRLNAEIRASEPYPLTGNDGGGEVISGLLNSVFDASFLANIYNGSQQRSADAIRQVYQNVDSIQYFPISGKMYWDDTVAEADPTNTLVSKLDDSRKITLFNGDCFINYGLRKLYSNAEFDVSDNNKNDLVKIGYTIGVINESNFNASIRSSETVNVNEGERKSPLQYVVKESSIGDLYGRGNQWRDYYLNESAGHNKGYDMTSGNILATPLSVEIPNIQSHWYARVWVSAQHVTNSFENGYRKFLSKTFKDYNADKGPIVKLIVNNNKLWCIQEGCVGIIPMNERIQTGADSGGPVYLESSNVLGPMGVISNEIGSRHKHSIVSTDNGVYGYSIDRNILWFGMEGSPLKRVSDLAIRSFLDDQYAGKPIPEIEMFAHDIIATWNKKFDEVIFTFINKTDAGFGSTDNFTVQINEITGKIHSFYSFLAGLYMRVCDDLYSFSAALPRPLWLHDSLNESIEKNTFYGTKHDSFISFVTSEAPGLNKDFTNQEIVSNRIMPKSAVFRVPGAKSDILFASIPNNIRLTNIQFKNGTWRYAIPKIKTVHNQDAEQSVPDTTAGYESILGIKSRVKGRYMITELTYNNGDLVELESIGTLYSVMK